jgi:hypothetical protein
VAVAVEYLAPPVKVLPDQQVQKVHQDLKESRAKQDFRVSRA